MAVSLRVAAALAVAAALGCSREEAPVAQPKDEEARRLEALGYLDYARTPAGSQRDGVVVRDPERSWPGYNLYAMPVLRRADLMDAEGRVLRTWQDREAHRWERAILCSNGDLLVVQRPNSLVRLDWNGARLWTSDVPAHHHVSAGPDGLVAVLTSRKRTLDGHHPPLVDDNGIALLSQGGELVAEKSIHDMLVRRPDVLRGPREDPESRPDPADPYHANFLHWKGAEVLVTLRHKNAVVAFDWERGEAVWAWGPGELLRPHDASWVEGGHVLLFDNRTGDGWSRVLEVHPRSGRIAWEYRAEGFYSETRGSAQRLPNGNTLISDSNAGRAFEVTRAGEIVWEFFAPERDGKGRRPTLRMARYDPAFVEPLLAGGPRAAEGTCAWP